MKIAIIAQTDLPLALLDPEQSGADACVFASDDRALARRARRRGFATVTGPLNDPRTRVYAGDVAKLLQKSKACFDVIALDVDNGPEGLTRSSNDWLYSLAGIMAAQRALAPGGLLAYWSAGLDADFHDCLRSCGFLVEEISVRAHGNKGPRYIIWLASGGS